MNDFQPVRRQDSPQGENPLSLLSRRHFLRTMGTAAIALSLPQGVLASLRSLAKPIRIGLIADLHQDVMHDGELRLDSFLQEMAVIKPDAIMQLGDFAYPSPKNRPVIDKFNQGHQTSLHVIGNHDTDAGYTKAKCLDIWGMSGRYYSHDIGGLRLLILDGNDRGSPNHKGGYPSYVGNEQVEWLQQQLGQHNGPCVIVSHQPLAGPWAVDNAEEIQAILSQHADKVLLSLCGHSHIDHLLRSGKVSYLHVNSASYQWVGGSYQHDSFSRGIHTQFPWISHTCPYREALFATLTLDPVAGTIRVKGKESAWVGKSPAELGVDLDPRVTNGEEVAPRIRSRLIEREAEGVRS